MHTETRRAVIAVASPADVVDARQRGREMARVLEFTNSDIVRIATAISELARNILVYAGEGEIDLTIIENQDRVGLGIVARDKGPGIPDVEKALQDGYSTSGGLGLGLPGTKRLMDEFKVESTVGKGTTVSVKKWKKRPHTT